MVPDYYLLVRRNIHVSQSSDEMQLSVFTCINCTSNKTNKLKLHFSEF